MVTRLIAYTTPEQCRSRPRLGHGTPSGSADEVRADPSCSLAGTGCGGMYVNRCSSTDAAHTDVFPANARRAIDPGTVLPPRFRVPVHPQFAPVHAHVGYGCPRDGARFKPTSRDGD